MAYVNVLVLALMVMGFLHAEAFDPSPVLDFCVADLNSKVLLNGFPCKNPNTVTVDDFVFRGIGTPRPVSGLLGTNVTVVNVNTFPGLNTQGISLERIDYAVKGINPPHHHPRGSEVLTVLEGKLYAGFVTAPPASKAFVTILKKGDSIIFPFAQIHFQMNLGSKPAAALSALSSQNPGVIRPANTLFGSNPPVEVEVLARSFQLSSAEAQHLIDLFHQPQGFASV